MRLTAASVVLLLSSCGGGASDTADVSNVLALKWTLFRSWWLKHRKANWCLS